MADTPTVLAREHHAFWSAWNAAIEAAINGLRPPPSHRCGDWCRPSSGPILLGLRGERITPGRGDG